MINFLAAILISDIALIVYLIYMVLMVLLSISIMLENRNPSSTIAYLLTLIFLPVLGLIIYLFFGQNFRKKRIFTRKIQKDYTRLKKWEDQHNYNFKEMQSLGLLNFHEKMNIARLLLKNNRAVLTSNNELKVLTNGEQAFPAFFKSIESARDHIHIDMYIVSRDATSQRLVDVLSEKARQGVEVRLSYDDVGSDISKSMLRQLREAGAEVHPFMPVQFPALTSKINYRNHKKIIVVDGKVGFVGGMNIADRYTNQNLDGNYWRDTHLQLKGDAVWSLQILFLLNWVFVSGSDLLSDSRYFPEVESEGDQLVQIVESGPDSQWSAIMQGLFAAISSAREYIYIQTPYFIPNEEISVALQTAALSGISVKIMIPQHNDSKIAQAASFSFLKSMLDAGAQVFLYNKGMLHAKTMMIDGNLCSIGTANMDQRSFDLNFEVNAFIYDLAITEQLVEDFKNDLKNCERLDTERWQKRKKYYRFTESMARILAPLL